MSYAVHEIGFLIKTGQHNRASRKLITALKANGGRIKDTADKLGCGRATINRWIKLLDDEGFHMLKNIEIIREESFR